MGRALTKSQTVRYKPKSNGSSRHGAGMMASGAKSIGLDGEDNLVENDKQTKSVLELDELSDFILRASMANQQFNVEREQFVVLDEVGEDANRAGGGGKNASFADDGFQFRELSVPRRPKWDESTTPEELERMEKESFVEWRRNIAVQEERLANGNDSSSRGVPRVTVTPFEKNLQVWKQLWRVLERSSCIVQIVDARNPLFYYSGDLKDYAEVELGKPMLMLINKSDYLTEPQRMMWHEHLNELGLDHYFFSAFEEQMKLDDIGKQPSDESSAAAEAKQGQDMIPNRSETNDPCGIRTLLTRAELTSTLHQYALSKECQPDPRYQNKVQFGMVGFPNVGKSSVINVLVGSSKHAHGYTRVGVASQPGKTKHFQTLLIPDNDDIMLCDCPGLVFPSFCSSTADLIAAGVFPIAQMRDIYPIVTLIANRIPRDIINAMYGISLPVPSRMDLKEAGVDTANGGEVAIPPPTAEELLDTYCIARSMYATASGVPDHQRAARVIIKDYVEGKLLFNHAPPIQGQEDGASALFMRETVRKNLEKDAKLREKLLSSAAVSTKDNKQDHKITSENENENEDPAAHFDDMADILDIIDAAGDAVQIDDNNTNTKSGNRRGNRHKSIQKHGKKGRKDRNKDPYGCHTDVNDTLNGMTASGGSGIIVNAGKYGSSNYTRPNYAGAKSAVGFQTSDNRPVKNR
mmetsp:Transcript_49236/g.73247  ORF Transcript_49236/g.73247 Transcript_49236/m.73247 type:complete len:692 (-) Transcript_49236:362-2437(-)